MQHQDLVQQPACHQLKCHSPHIVQKYLYVLSWKLEQLQDKDRTAELFTVSSTGVWTTEHELAYNSLDQEFNMAKLKAKSLCWKIQAGNIPWTPELTQAIQRILYWKAWWAKC